MRKGFPVGKDLTDAVTDRRDQDTEDARNNRSELAAILELGTSEFPADRMATVMYESAMQVIWGRYAKFLHRELNSFPIGHHMSAEAQYHQAVALALRKTVDDERDRLLRPTGSHSAPIDRTVQHYTEQAARNFLAFADTLGG